MSFEAMAWASKQQTANSGQKLVLLMLADYTNADTGQCNPSHQRLAEKCCMGISTLKRHIDDLAEIGFLTKVPHFIESVQRPNSYVLHIPGSPNWTDPQPKSGLPPAQIGLQNQEIKPVIEPSLSGSVLTIPFDKIIDAYELCLPNCPVVRRSLFVNGASAKDTKQRYQWVMSSKHERGPRAGQRLAETEEQAIEWFDKFFGYVAQSDFLAKQFRCNLKWLMKRENFEKVLSGQYHKES